MKPFIHQPQLCAIARAEITASPRIDDSEWGERIKCRLVALGFAYPTPHDLTAAMRQVECALSRRWGRRPCAP